MKKPTMVIQHPSVRGNTSDAILNTMMRQKHANTKFDSFAHKGYVHIILNREKEVTKQTCPTKYLVVPRPTNQSHRFKRRNG